MALAYTIKNQWAVHYVTFTVHQWVDVFTRSAYTEILLNSIKHCQKNRGLEVYAWVIMSNHCHLILKAEKGDLSDIIRDLKKFTSKSIYQAIKNNKQESRRKWLLLTLSYEGRVWFWEEGYHGIEIESDRMFESKVGYVHQNPVRAGIVLQEQDYLLSSAADFYGERKGALDLSIF